ncbi:MAG: cob(I)yrinic acid a,c-diamide adenosyltransferase, partial [Selenomonadaceae bacterium]|nr:cob(I)yrinic acid a,c-diamide adenosyltransferase [Selenomonadaceae bacterium]
ILSGAWDLIILDEINYAVKFGLVDASEILSLLEIRPPELHLVFTGRAAPAELIDAADLVTEMKLIKHPFQQGISAQSGIEF